MTIERIFPRRIAELTAATPADRNRYVDFLRAASIVVVVLGHWLMAVLWWENGQITSKNLLLVLPSTQILTWLLQVMPVFFIVGGFANATSWEHAKRRGMTYGAWLSARARRMLRPTVAFVLVWTILPTVAVVASLRPEAARAAAHEISAPLWFLTIYLVAVALAPAVAIVHRRFGPVLVVGVLAVATLLVDVALYGLSISWAGDLNYVFVWLAVLELGFCWHDGHLRSRRISASLAAGGFATVVALVAVANYPLSMVNVSGEIRSNLFPPSLALLALGIMQTGLIGLTETLGNRWLQRPRVWYSVAVANRVVLTSYLWNMTAVLLAAETLLRHVPSTEPGSSMWWAWRPIWLATCTVFLVALVALFKRFEEPTRVHEGTASPNDVLAVCCIAVVAFGLRTLANGNFPVPRLPSTQGVIAVAAVLLGTGVLTGWRLRRPRRSGADGLRGWDSNPEPTD